VDMGFEELTAICQWHIARFRLDGIGSLQFFPRKELASNPIIRELNARPLELVCPTREPLWLNQIYKIGRQKLTDSFCFFFCNCYTLGRDFYD